MTKLIIKIITDEFCVKWLINWLIAAALIYSRDMQLKLYHHVTNHVLILHEDHNWNNSTVSCLNDSSVVCKESEKRIFSKHQLIDNV